MKRCQGTDLLTSQISMSFCYVLLVALLVDECHVMCHTAIGVFKSSGSPSASNRALKLICITCHVCCRRYKTEVGHILGSANQRTGPTAERKLSSLSCSVIRCLTHMSMFAGALFDPDKVR